MFKLAPKRSGILLLPLLGILSATPGCRDKEVTAYRIPKEPEPAAAAAAPAARSETRWSAPPGWEARPASGMRLGSFRVPGANGSSADVSIISFPGSGGDDLANVNRWRGQVELPPVGADSLSAQTHDLKTSAGTFVVADFAGLAPSNHAPTRLLGGWLRLPDRVWFFKMIGPADLVGSQKAAFLAFLKSVDTANLAAGGSAALAAPGATPANTNDLPQGASPGPDLASMPPGHPSVSGGMAQPAGDSPLRWTAPAAWTKRQASSMRKGSYSLDPAGTVELAITVFPGDVGGTLANVNRWLGQVGLPPVAEGDLPQVTAPLAANGLNFVVVDTGAKDPSAPRIVAGLASWEGNTWFFKVTGPTGKVGDFKPAFLEFLRTVRPAVSQ